MIIYCSDHFCPPMMPARMERSLLFISRSKVLQVKFSSCSLSPLIAKIYWECVSIESLNSDRLQLQHSSLTFCVHPTGVNSDCISNSSKLKAATGQLF